MNNNNKEAVQKVIFGQPFLYFNGKRFFRVFQCLFFGRFTNSFSPTSHSVRSAGTQEKKGNQDVEDFFHLF